MMRESVSPIADQVFSKLSSQLSDQEVKTFSLVSYNITALSGLEEGSEVKGTPVISLFKYEVCLHLISFHRSGEWKADYHGSLNAESIIAWASMRINPGLTYLSSQEDLVSFRLSHRKHAIGYFPSADQDILNVFRLVAQAIPDLSFAYASDAYLGTDRILVSLDDETHVIHKHIDDENHLFRTMTFLLFPRPIIVDQISIRDILSAPFPIIFIFTNKTETNIDSRTLDAVRDSGILLAIVDCDSTDPVVNHLSNFLGASSSCPGLWILEDPTNSDSFKAHKSVAQHSSQNILDFVSEWSQKQLQRFVKSDLPEPVSYHEARVVVGSEWETFVKADKAKLVLFYTIWCSFCLSVVEIFDDFAKTGAIPNLVVSKMDKARNDSPGLAVDEFPSVIFLLPRTLSGHERYGGPMTRESLLVWTQTLMKTVPVYSPPETTKRPPVRDEL
jgi:thiol-disulfide isomerase/thioredoxin